MSCTSIHVCLSKIFQQLFLKQCIIISHIQYKQLRRLRQTNEVSGIWGFNGNAKLRFSVLWIYTCGVELKQLLRELVVALRLVKLGYLTLYHN